LNLTDAIALKKVDKNIGLLERLLLSKIAISDNISDIQFGFKTGDSTCADVFLRIAVLQAIHQLNTR